VDLPSTESTGSTERPATSAFIFPSSYTPVEPTVDQSKNTLVIKNLPFKYKPVDLEALLVRVCCIQLRLFKSEHQAKPKNVRLLRDDAGRFSGMAFIRCISKEEAQRLIFCMNDLDIGGRNIQVEFKMKKKKKAGLRASSDDASGLSSSSEDLPYGSRLRTSAENANEAPTTTVSTQIQPSQLSLQQEKKSAAPSGPRKLAVSAEHNFSDKFRKPPQMRRKSTSAVLDTLYSHSALFKTHPTLTQSVLPSIRPIRQPLGPDGKSNGFSLEYRKSRGHP
jgi:RNA recognition motif-containing protein